MAASFLAPRASSVWPQVVAIVLVAVGMLLAQSTTAPRLLRLTAPVLGLVGGAVATGVLSEGPVVALVGACAGAALVALTGRSGAGPDRYVPRVWLTFAGGLGGLALLVLVMGLSLASVAAIGLAVVVLAARVVPDLVLDVDDDVLLDISRLSVTSWSPREARRPRRRGWRIDDEAVGDVVVAASVEQLATLVGLAVVSAGCSAVLLGVLVTQTAVSALSVQLLLLAAAVALTLTARAYRRRSDRTLLRLAALAPALSVGLPVAASLGETWGVVAAAARRRRRPGVGRRRPGARPRVPVAVGQPARRPARAAGAAGGPAPRPLGRRDRRARDGPLRLTSRRGECAPVSIPGEGAHRRLSTRTQIALRRHIGAGQTLVAGCAVRHSHIAEQG